MQLIPNREIGFGFVSCSCRVCVRACEAAWACEGMCFSSLVARMPGCAGSGAASPRLSVGLVRCSAQGF